MKRAPPPSLNERISAEKARLLVEASRTPPGPARNEMIGKLRQLDLAANINEFLSTPSAQAARSQGDPDPA